MAEDKDLFKSLLGRYQNAVKGVDDSFYEENNIEALRPQSIPFGVRGRGTAYIFRYLVPKGRATLPYYTVMPFVITLDRTPKTLTGLNLFYLPARLREVILNLYLSRTTSQTIEGRSTLLYETLKKQKIFYSTIKPAVKQYQVKRMGPIAFRVAPQSWNLLYNEKPSNTLLKGFMKKTAPQVHYYSKAEIIRNLLSPA
mgnify:FL=1